MWHSSLTRDQTQRPGSLREAVSLNHWTAKKSPHSTLLSFYFSFKSTGFSLEFLAHHMCLHSLPKNLFTVPSLLFWVFASPPLLSCNFFQKKKKGGEKEKATKQVREKGRKELTVKGKKVSLSIRLGISPQTSNWIQERSENGYFDHQGPELYKLLGDLPGSIKSRTCQGCVLMWRRLRK